MRVPGLQNKSIVTFKLVARGLLLASKKQQTESGVSHQDLRLIHRHLNQTNANLRHSDANVEGGVLVIDQALRKGSNGSWILELSGRSIRYLGFTGSKDNHHPTVKWSDHTTVWEASCTWGCGVQ